MRYGYKTGFAPRDGMPKYPSLWRGCVGAWCPSLGCSGLTLYDWSGRKQHGQIINTTAATAWKPGYLDLTGTNDSVLLGQWLVPYPRNMFTFTAWIVTFNATDNRAIISRPLAAHPWYSVYLGTVVTAFTSGSTLYYTSPDLVLSTGIWLHLAGTFDGSTLRLYLNGMEVRSTSGSGDINYAGVKNWTIGTWDSAFATDTNLNGYIDDVRIYNRALSHKEIALLAKRRGISYELDWEQWFPTSGNRRRRFLVAS